MAFTLSPSTADVEEWAAAFADSYATLGARFDYLDNIMVYSEGGAQGEEYIADDQFFDRLLTWVEGITADRSRRYGETALWYGRRS